jgi:hypothetical protein
VDRAVIIYGFNSCVSGLLNCLLFSLSFSLLCSACRHVDPTAVHPFYTSVVEPIRARLLVTTFEQLVDYPKRQVAPDLDKYRVLVKEIHTYINQFQRERYSTYDQNDMLRAIDQKLRLNDPLNVLLQELKEWLVYVVECKDTVSVRKNAPSATSYLGVLSNKDPPAGNKLDMAQALLELKNFSVTSNVSRQIDNYRCYLLELMSCSEFGYSTSVAFGQIAAALTSIGLQADADCKEAIEVKCFDEMSQYTIHNHQRAENNEPAQGFFICAYE